MDKLLSKLPLLLDGATGTNLFKAGMPHDGCPEQWIIDNPQHIIALQKSYVKSGSDCILAPTFTANRAKLTHYGLQDNVKEINTKLIKFTKQAAESNCFIGGDMSPTGLFSVPYGEIPFEELIDIYKEQAKAIYDTGVDFIFLETMISLSEARAAVIAVKEFCGLPVFVSMTVDEDGRTLSGNSALACLIALQAMGVSAFGLNCSTGPDEMLNNLIKIAPYAKIPLIAKPNAGMPDISDETKILSPQIFSDFAVKAVTNGIGIIGGCCGTDPSHIQKMKEAISEIEFTQPVYQADEEDLIIAGEKDVFFLRADLDLSPALECDDDLPEKFIGLENISCDAALVEFNSFDDVDIFNLYSYILKLPLCAACSDNDILNYLARIYNGNLLIDSRSIEDEEAAEEIVKKYGCVII